MAQTNGVHTNGHGGGTGPTVHTDYLIVGTGPAGASLGCFLAQHGKNSNRSLESSDG
jgi:hypothetical protein